MEVSNNGDDATGGDVCAVVGARRKGVALRLVSQGLDVTYSASGVHWDEALRFLAGAEPLQEGEAAPEPEAARGARVA